MRFQNIGSVYRQNDSLLGYRMVVVGLNMTVTLVGEKCDLFELKFNGVQSYRFTPDDLAILPEDVDLDALQCAMDKSWLDGLRIPTDVHRKYLQGHDLYIMHATDVGLLEVVAFTAEMNALI
jgi:hypothetical protein